MYNLHASSFERVEINLHMRNTHFVNNFIIAQPNFFKHAKGTNKDNLKVLRETVRIWGKKVKKHQ